MSRVIAGLVGVCLLGLLLGNFSSFLPLPALDSHSSPIQFSFTGDPLGHFEGIGSPVGISWTGDGERISNPSFEGSSLSPWVQMQSDAASSSSITISKTAYDGKNSTQLALLSGSLTTSTGNLTSSSGEIPSSLSLFQDIGQEHAGFSSSMRFLAAISLQQLTGATVSDRTEISISLTTSTGQTRVVHYVFASGSNLPSNSATDAYYNVGPPAIGQWMTIDRNVATDALNAFPGDYPTINSAAQVTLTVLSQTQPGPPNHDPHIKYWNVNTTLFHHWQSGLPVIYDANNNGVYDDGDYVLGGCTPPPCTTPPAATPLSDDPLIRFVDSNNNGVWDTGESVVYDGNNIESNDGVYGFYDPVIAGATPAIGTLLIKVFQNHTTSLFDKVELYSATGGSEWIKNSGFETGLVGWGADPGFTAGSSPVRSGSLSAKGTVTNGIIKMAESIDGRPLVDSSTVFEASANIVTMTGTSSSDTVHVWLALVDSQYSPVSLYYVFGTGDGSMPSNRTDTVYRRVVGFGTFNQWLSINASLSQETAAFNLLGYTPPYTLEAVVVEIVAQGSSSTTTASFDDLSIRTATHSGTTAPSFYALDAQNTTYLYNALAIPQGSLHLELPSQETILNITTPEGTMLQKTEYSSSTIPNCTIAPCLPNPRAVDIPYSTFFKHPPVGNWKIFAVSINTVAKVYVENATTHSPAPSINVGSTVNLVSQFKDPLAQPLSGVPVNLTLWNTNTGTESGSWIGSTNNLGWWNVSSVTLPPTGSPPGIYSLQAAILSPYPAIRTFQVSVRYTVTVNLSLSSTQASTGSSITISGSVTEAGTSTPAPGVNVTLSYRLAGTSQWTTLGTVKTDASGKYSYMWNPLDGDYEIMASTGDTQTAPAESTRTQLSVGPAGFSFGPWLLVIAAVAAALSIVLVAILLMRKRRLNPKTPC